jgi:cytochrome c oxidase assembly protein subunit 15
MQDHPHTLAVALAKREGRNRAIVRWWLYFVCFLILLMVAVGGATRLTDSGLSITEWKPIHGFIPPIGEEQWQEEFDKYRQIPEYQQVNKGMSMAEFQFIYWWEWGHRFLGRIIGIVFAVPLALLWWSGRLEQRLKPRLLLLLGLGGLQGFVGWWMVKSGLVDRVDVSQYRLAVHLTLACLIFAYALWIARGLAPAVPEHAPFALRAFAPLMTLAIVIQIFLGGLVAGLDAGLAFNDWPLMDGAIWPGQLLVIDPAWRNFFENPKTVQFVHRMSAYGVLALALLQYLLYRATEASGRPKRRAGVFLFLVLAQAAIGVATLVMQVPLEWALAHQVGAVVVLAFAVAHWRGLVGPYAPVTSVVLRS